MTRQAMFTITLEADSAFTIDECWPDGDAPDHPTAEQVIDRLKSHGSILSAIADWGIDDNLTVTVIAPNGHVAEWAS